MLLLLVSMHYTVTRADSVRIFFKVIVRISLASLSGSSYSLSPPSPSARALTYNSDVTVIATAVVQTFKSRVVQNLIQLIINS